MARRSSMLATFAITGTSLFMTSLDNLVVTTALPAIRTDLGVGLSGLEWTVSAYTLTFAVFLLAAAAYGDRFGRRRMFLAGLSLFTAASAAAALAPGIGPLVAARAAQGVGGALVVPLTLTILTNAVPVDRRPVALAWWSVMSGLAIAVGPVVGGAILAGGHWQWIFWINVPIGTVLLLSARACLAESRGPHARLDVPGTALVTLATFGLVLGLVLSDTAGWGSARVWTSLAGGAAVFALFLARERRATAPVVPPRLFADRGFAAGNATALLLTVGMFGCVFLLAQFLQTVQGCSPLSAGLRTLPWTGAPIVAAPVAGVLADRVGMRVLIRTGTALQLVAVVWLALEVTPTVGYASMVPPLVLAGVGMGLFFAVIAPLVLGFADREDEGMASGVSNAVREFGVVLGIAALAAVFAANGGYSSGTAYVAGLRPALWAGAALVAGAFAASLFIPPAPAAAAAATGDRSPDGTLRQQGASSR